MTWFISSDVDRLSSGSFHSRFFPSSLSSADLPPEAGLQALFAGEDIKEEKYDIYVKRVDYYKLNVYIRTSCIW